jgi:DNA-binding IclR family transcriptional regulator
MYHNYKRGKSLANRKSASGNSIFRAVNILTCIGQGATSITDIAETCNLSKATVHRLLKVLAETQLVHHDPINRQYILGTLFIQFVSKPQITHAYLNICAYGEMKRLAELTQDTIHLDIVSGLHDVVLKAVPSKHTFANSRRNW